MSHDQRRGSSNNLTNPSPSHRSRNFLVKSQIQDIRTHRRPTREYHDGSPDLDRRRSNLHLNTDSANSTFASNVVTPTNSRVPNVVVSSIQQSRLGKKDTIPSPSNVDVTRSVSRQQKIGGIIPSGMKGNARRIQKESNVTSSTKIQTNIVQHNIRPSGLVTPSPRGKASFAFNDTAVKISSATRRRILSTTPTTVRDAKPSPCTAASASIMNTLNDKSLLASGRKYLASGAKRIVE